MRFRDTEEYQKRIAYERGLFEKVKEYVKNEMSAENKDKIYQIMAPSPLHFQALKDNPNYEKLRDEAVARDLLVTGLAYEIPIEEINKKFEKEYVRSWSGIEKLNRDANNAVKGLSKFPDVVKEILRITGDDALDPSQMVYQGADTYIYRNAVIINFSRSPLAVTIMAL